MTEEEKIMSAIRAHHPHGACRHHMPPADRANDRARQKLRRAGLIVYADRGMGMRWFLAAPQEIDHE